MDNDEKTIKAFLYETLVNGLLANSSLTYYNDSLLFDSSYIDTMLKTINPHAYLSRFEELKREKEENENVSNV